MVENILTLVMLVLLQAVLGFDNLLYISLETKQVVKEKQGFVRNMGIGIAIILRIVLLFVLIAVIKLVEEPFLHIAIGDYIKAELSGHSLIVLAGGAFILYTAIKEIWHMMSLGDHADENGEKKQRSIGSVITMIVVMNIVFSFDSILGAMAITDTLWVMVTAILISGVMMIWLSGKVSQFLAKNRMYEVLGLFILFLVGVVLLSEGGHLAQMELFGSHVEKMSSATFYFVIVVLVAIDIVQGRYQKKIVREKNKGLDNF